MPHADQFIIKSVRFVEGGREEEDVGMSLAGKLGAGRRPLLALEGARIQEL